MLKLTLKWACEQRISILFSMLIWIDLDIINSGFSLGINYIVLVFFSLYYVSGGDGGGSVATMFISDVNLNNLNFYFIFK